MRQILFALLACSACDDRPLQSTAHDLVTCDLSNWGWLPGNPERPPEGTQCERACETKPVQDGAACIGTCNDGMNRSCSDTFEYEGAQGCCFILETFLFCECNP